MHPTPSSRRGCSTAEARLTAVIPPVSDRLSVTMRKYTVADETLGSLVERSSLPDEAAAFLWTLAQVAGSVLYLGRHRCRQDNGDERLPARGARRQCIRMCEEVRELHIPLSLHSSFYEARPVAMDGGRRYSLRDLIKVCLAQRVDLLCVGEVRGEEAYELTRAVNAGCGFTCTIHANSAREAPSALVENSLKAGENIPEPAVRQSFARGIDVVVHLDRRPRVRAWRQGPKRQVAEILSVAPSLARRLHHRADLHPPGAGARRWSGPALMPQPELVRRLMDGHPPGGCRHQGRARRRVEAAPVRVMAALLRRARRRVPAGGATSGRRRTSPSSAASRHHPGVEATTVADPGGLRSHAPPVPTGVDRRAAGHLRPASWLLTRA